VPVAPPVNDVAAVVSKVAIAVDDDNNVSGNTCTYSARTTTTETEPIEFIDDTQTANALDSLEQLMGEAAAVRKEAMSGNLPDEVRRQRAEETAMKLVNLLGSMDFGDEEEEEDDDDST